MHADRVDSIIQYALLAAGHNDEFTERELGRIHFIKLVYLADLAFAERHAGETFTAAPWQFFHYGPWAAEVNDRIEPALAAIDAVEKKVPSQFESDFTRWWKVDDRLCEKIERLLPLEVASAVRRAVKEYGRDTGELLHHVYATSPMLYARPRQRLDFTTAAIEPDVPAPASTTLPAGRKAQKRAEAHERELKSLLRQKLEQKRKERHARTVTAPARPPRYDDVFAEGVAWLEAAAGPAIPVGKGEAEFADDVWESEVRRDRRN
jgi:hypothetical protein